MSFSVWVTGPDENAVQAVADEIARRLAVRHVALEILDARAPGIDALAGDGMDRRAAFVAGALARHGVASVVALRVDTRAARERARAVIGRMIEVHVRPERESAGTSYEAPDRAEVEVVVPEASAGAGAEQTLRTLEILDFLPRGEERGYSEAEEREVIRRLKAFGYL